MVYASEFKHSISEDVYKLMNPNLNQKSKVFRHIKIKELLKLKDKAEYLKYLQGIIPEAIDLTNETCISKPIESK